MPIDLRIQDDFPVTLAAYAHYDVLIVNAISDGMNLVAKEGPILNRRDGVLILSEYAGAFEELGAFALGVNPFDIEQQADALHEALTMPADERESRAGHAAPRRRGEQHREVGRRRSSPTSPPSSTPAADRAGGRRRRSLSRRLSVGRAITR